jgi:pectinesterase
MRSWLIALLVLGASVAQAQTVVVTVKNPARFDRQHETIAVPLGQLSPLLGSSDAALLRVRKEGGKTSLPIQVTATDVLFQCDLQARASAKYVISVAPVRDVPQPSLVSGLFAVPREDYAWENDRIAFRMYGPAMAADVNNGVDVWTKRVRYPIVAKWYKEAEGSAPGKDTYHQDRGEGADYFSVGRSLGAGGSGLWIDGKLVQPGVFTSWKTLATGPIRVAFLLTYTWRMGADTVREERMISLDAGENLNRIEVRYIGARGMAAATVAGGLVKRAGTLPTRNVGECTLSLWGPTVADPAAGELGTAVVFPAGACTEITEDKDQYLMIGRAQAGVPFVYHAGAGWTGNGGFTRGADWVAYLHRFVQRMAEPLQISLRQGK